MFLFHGTFIIIHKKTKQNKTKHNDGEIDDNHNQRQNGYIHSLSINAKTSINTCLIYKSLPLVKDIDAM